MIGMCGIYVIIVVLKQFSTTCTAHMYTVCGVSIFAQSNQLTLTVSSTFNFFKGHNLPTLFPRHQKYIWLRWNISNFWLNSVGLCNMDADRIIINIFQSINHIFQHLIQLNKYICKIFTQSRPHDLILTLLQNITDKTSQKKKSGHYQTNHLKPWINIPSFISIDFCEKEFKPLKHVNSKLGLYGPYPQSKETLGVSQSLSNY